MRGMIARRAVLFVLAILLAPGFAGGGLSVAAKGLTPEEGNLAYCIVVLTRAAFGGERAGEDDPGAAAVLMERLKTRLGTGEADVAARTLPPIAATVAADMARKGRPRFSATACEGYAHYIKTE